MDALATVKLNAQRAAHVSRIRNNLLASLGINTNPAQYRTFTPNVMDVGNASHPNLNQGGLSIPYGTSPNDRQFEEYFKMQGGYPAELSLPGEPNYAAPPAQGMGPLPRQRGGDATALDPNQQLIQDIVMEGVGDNRRAREETLARYNESKGLAIDVARRDQEGIGEWGKAQEELNRQQASESLGNQLASLNAHGLGNSNVPTYAMGRNARDLALTQQDLTEKRLDLKRRYDSTDTDRLMQLIGSRNDLPGIDIGTAAGILQNLGASGGGHGSPELQQQIDDIRGQLTGGGGFDPNALGGLPLRSGPQGGAIPYFLNGTPADLGNRFLANYYGQAGLGISSNRYPTPRGPQTAAINAGGGVPMNQPMAGLPTLPLPRKRKLRPTY